METFQMEYRCTCEALLFKGFTIGGLVEIKCRRCGRMNAFGELPSKEETKYFVIVYGKDGAILECSSTAADVLGYSREELLARTAFDISESSTPERYAKTWGLIEQMHFSPIVSDVRLRAKNGSVVEARVKCIIPKKAGRPHLIAIGEVFSRCDSAAGDLAERNTGIQIEDVIAHIGADGKIMYASARFCELMACTEDELIGCGVESLLLFEQTGITEEEFRRFCAAHRAFYVPQAAFEAKNGDPIECAVHFIPAFSDNNRFKGYKLVHSIQISSAVDKAAVGKVRRV